MISKDYDALLKASKFVEDDIVKECWKVMDKYNYPSGIVEHKLFIIPGYSVIDRYIEATYIDGIEVLTIEVSGRSIAVMNIGYRECKRMHNH